MSLTINNTVAQQQSLPAQAATTQTTTPAATATPGTSNGTGAAGGTTATAEPSASLISGNAALTSDLLSVLLQQQSDVGSTSFGSPGSFGSLASSGTTPSGSQDVTLAGILNQQDQATQNQLGGIDSLDPASAVQSANSTGDVLGGLQTLLDQLAL